MVSRRTLLLGGAGAVGLGLAGCSPDRTPVVVSPTGPQVAAGEAARNPGPVREYTLSPQPSDVDLGGLVVSTWTYGDALPGRPIRVTAGEQVKAVVHNRLPTDTSVHWHGVALRNDADGVPMVTQEPIPAGGEYTYQFTAPHPGTYWFHPHTGVQLDRGLYAPLVVEDPREPLAYDEEWVVILDDWLDGVDARTPDGQLDELRGGMGSMMGGGHMMGGMRSILLGGDAGDVTYPHYLVNGRTPVDPDVHIGQAGQRLRIRFVNAGSDTAFRVALGGHSMTVTHTDGFPVTAHETDALLIGMGERYDVLVILADGVFPLVAQAEGKEAAGLALIRTSATATAPDPGVRPAELDRRIVAYRQLHADPGVALSTQDVDRTVTLRLTGGMMDYDWRFDGRAFDHARVDHLVTGGDRVRIDYINTTMMWHPVHLHGHTFAVGDVTGPRKDTAIVLPGQTLSTFFDADNPGRWMIHCHNAYHAEAGMMTLLGYLG